MKKLFLLFVSVLVSGAMVLESSGNGRSPKPPNQGDAQLTGEHQVEGRKVTKPQKLLARQSVDLPTGYVLVYQYPRSQKNVSINF